MFKLDNNDTKLLIIFTVDFQQTHGHWVYIYWVYIYDVTSCVEIDCDRSFLHMVLLAHQRH